MRAGELRYSFGVVFTLIISRSSYNWFNTILLTLVVNRVFLMSSFIECLCNQ
jgi:hypothetical protein